MTVTLFIPCFVDVLFPRAGISMVQILEGLGHRVICPEGIACCGQPPFNSGYWDEARLIAAPVLDKLKDAEVVVVGSASRFTWFNRPCCRPRRQVSREFSAVAAWFW
jgi:L-lactate dehydrogenase complex protein LldE